MNLRLLIRPVLVLVFAPLARGQQMCSRYADEPQPVHAAAKTMVSIAANGCDKARANTGDSSGIGQQSITEILTREELRRRIAVYETAVREAQSTGAGAAIVAKVYARLASLYEDAGSYDRAQAALEYAVSLLRRSAGDSSHLAEYINDLGLLHATVGELAKAEREDREALRMREDLGDSLGIARSWNALSGVYFREHKYEEARDFARRALEEFSGNRQTDVIDQVSSRLNLAVALCYANQCPSAIPLLKDAIAITKSAFRPDDFPIGEAEFLLGFAYWRSGELAGASEYMERGTTLMKEQMGWGHPAYLNALGQYSRFLRERRRIEDAKVVERQIRQAEAVVDVHSLRTRKGGDGLAELR